MWAMGTQRYTTEEIIHKLREADVLIGRGQTALSRSTEAPTAQRSIKA
jgi:uncharacterized protein with PhoU and TrkA domain